MMRLANFGSTVSSWHPLRGSALVGAVGFVFGRGLLSRHVDLAGDYKAFPRDEGKYYTGTGLRCLCSVTRYPRAGSLRRYNGNEGEGRNARRGIASRFITDTCIPRAHVGAEFCHRGLRLPAPPCRGRPGWAVVAGGKRKEDWLFALG